MFFLPLALLYAITGALYITGSRGTVSETRLTVELGEGWPDTIGAARELVTERLRRDGLPEANPVAGERVLPDGGYYWRALTHSVTLNPPAGGRAEISVQENSLFRQLVEIHKNHAGPWFAVLGFSFGLAMTILIVSGAWMMLGSSLYRRSANLLLSCGLAASVLAYVVTVAV